MRLICVWVAGLSLFCAGKCAGEVWGVPLQPAQLIETTGPYLAPPLWVVPLWLPVTGITFRSGSHVDIVSGRNGQTVRLGQPLEFWRRVDLNHRPPGYEPGELPLLYAAEDFIAYRHGAVKRPPRSGISQRVGQAYGGLSQKAVQCPS